MKIGRLAAAVQSDSCLHGCQPEYHYKFWTVRREIILAKTHNWHQLVSNKQLQRIGSHLHEVTLRNYSFLKLWILLALDLWAKSPSNTERTLYWGMCLSTSTLRSGQETERNRWIRMTERRQRGETKHSSNQVSTPAPTLQAQASTKHRHNSIASINNLCSSKGHQHFVIAICTKSTTS